MSTPDEQANIALYQSFLAALNTADYDEIARIIDPAFEDHHPGFEVHGLPDYLAALRGAHDTLQLEGKLVEALAVGDKVVTRCELTGRHVGPVFGFAPSGKPVAWTTTEIWRVADGRLVERWAEDDLLGLRGQLSPDADNVALITRLNDVVNGRRYDDMDELFGSTFVDQNAAWSVKDLGELKEIIRSAHEALDFSSHHDLIYPADGGKVVIHITFTGRHVKEFLGQPPTGRPVQWTSIEIYRIENKKIVERWVQADTTGLMRQLGAELAG
jgi:predicted ester cyclase